MIHKESYYTIICTGVYLLLDHNNQGVKGARYSNHALDQQIVVMHSHMFLKVFESQTSCKTGFGKWVWHIRALLEICA